MGGGCGVEGGWGGWGVTLIMGINQYHRINLLFQKRYGFETVVQTFLDATL